MFERFSDPARRVVALAQEEARKLDHVYIGTEHLLLGLIEEGQGIAAKRVLAGFGITAPAVRDLVVEIIGRGRGGAPGPFRSRRGRRARSSTRGTRPGGAAPTSSAPSICCSACCATARASPARS